MHEPPPQEKRDEPWGVFSLAELARNTKHGKVLIGWGANCRRHTNSTDCVKDNRCQKQVTTSDSSPASLLECRRLAKVWLLLGLEIPTDDVRGRLGHVKEYGGITFRRHAPAWTEEECNAQLEAAGLHRA